MAKPDEDTIASLHRYFAVENNNRAWELAEKEDRSHKDKIDMLNAAAAAAVHWDAVGTDMHRARATYLLALVHAFCSHGDTAKTLLTESLALIGDEELPDWEQVFLAAVASEAACAAGDSVVHSKEYERTARLLEAVADKEDAAICRSTVNQLTVPS